MLDELLSREETSSALILALSGTIVVLMANGPGAVPLKRVVSVALSNPVPCSEPAGRKIPRVLPGNSLENRRIKPIVK